MQVPQLLPGRLADCVRTLKTYPTLPYPVSVGANLEVDVPWKYLNFFLDDDMRLVEIGREYKAGRMLTGEVKKELIGVRLPPGPAWAPCGARDVFKRHALHCWAGVPASVVTAAGDRPYTLLCLKWYGVCLGCAECSG